MQFYLDTFAKDKGESTLLENLLTACKNINMSKNRLSINDILLPRYKTIPYRVIGKVPNFLMQDVYYAVSQAFSIWSAFIPVAFIKKTTITQGDVHINFVPDAPGGALGNAIIEIDTTESFFIDKFRTSDTASWGPFDLIGVLAHEIGHNILNANHNQTPGSMMSDSFGEGQVKRMLHEVDIALAQNVFGKLPAASLIKMKLENADQINYAPKVVFQKSATTITISGEGGTTSVFQIYLTEVKNKKINAINLKVKTHSSYTIINSIQIWDALVPQEMHVISLSSYQDTPKEFDLKLGLSRKPVFKYGLLIRIEILFLEKFQNESRPNANRIRKVDVSAINIEAIPPPRPTEILQ